MDTVGIGDISLGQFGLLFAALSALSGAAFGLLDSSKAFWGGVSRVGLRHIEGALLPFAAALEAAVGPDWRLMARANWLNGMAKAEQKARVRALIKLGLSEATAGGLALGDLLTPAALKTAARKLQDGTELSELDLNVLGRLNARIDAVLDYAFERAEQQYRNVARALAGLIAILLALGAWAAWPWLDAGERPGLMAALALGLLAVPLAPVAKDLTSGLSAALRALKTTQAI